MLITYIIYQQRLCAFMYICSYICICFFNICMHICMYVCTKCADFTYVCTYVPRICVLAMTLVRLMPLHAVDSINVDYYGNGSHMH